jgi:uncharacterized protein YjdB
MTFLHKLSQRLARMKTLWLMTALALAACERPIAAVDPATSRVATWLVVSPASVTLFPNQTTDLTAVGLTASGDTGSVAVVWSVTGGAIVDTSAAGGRHYGRYQSGAPGQYKVVAHGNPGDLSDTATITVSLVPVAAVTVSPAMASLAPGATQQLAATPRDSAGGTLSGRTVTWMSGNPAVATVNGTGLVTAVTPGSTIATATSDGKSGTSTITVTAPPAPTPSPSTVTDLALAGVTDTSATLTFTEVSDGTGQPASYDVRYAAGTISWGSATAVARGTCTRPLAGTTIGARRTCTVLGLAASTAYGFQLVAFRGTFGVDAVVGAVSNVASGTTGAGAPTPVASVTVSPASASISVGGTQQFTATLRDASGSVLSGRAISWTSSPVNVATVSANGLVTALLAGTTTITATSEGQSGTATATVTALPPPPPPPPGATILVQEAFEDGAFVSRGWYDNTAMTTTAAQHIPGSTRALEARFVLGATTPTWSSAARHLFAATESVYLSYWVKYSANWVGSGQAYHPHEFLLLTTENDAWVGPSFTHLTAYVEHSYQNGGIPVLQLQDGQNIDQGRIAQDLTTITENRSAAGCNGNSDGYATGCYNLGGGVYNNEKKWIADRPYLMPTPGPGYKNDWHLVEAYFKLNSIQNGRGVADGVVRYWFDRQLVIEHTDVLLRTGAHPNMKFNQLMVAPYIGSGSPVDQTMWVDDLTVATARP